MSLIDQLRPASKPDVIVYIPYYGKEKHKVLPYAISLYQKGNLEGERTIEGGDNISFVAIWDVSKLPAEITTCRLQFSQQAELSYELSILNSDFIDYLIDLIIEYRRSRLTDFPRAFYRKLLRFDE